MVEHEHVEQTRPERALAMQEAASQLGRLSVEIIAAEGEPYGHQSGALVNPGNVGIRVTGEVPVEDGTTMLFTLTKQILEQRGQALPDADTLSPKTDKPRRLSVPMRKNVQKRPDSKPKVAKQESPKPRKKAKPAPSDPIKDKIFTDHMSRITRRTIQ